MLLKEGRTVLHLKAHGTDRCLSPQVNRLILWKKPKEYTELGFPVVVRPLTMGGTGGPCLNIHELRTIAERGISVVAGWPGSY